MQQDLLKELTDNIYPIEDYNKRLFAYKEWVWRAATAYAMPGNFVEIKRELERDFSFNHTPIVIGQITENERNEA